jgi:predicted enzyme related to lactoylglutathione lyase
VTRRKSTTDMELRGVSVQNNSASSQTRGKRTMSNADIRGRFIWHELVTTDPEAAAAFYSKVVPWKTQDSGMPSYTLWMAGKTQVGGLTGLPESAEAGTPPHWIIYIATPDVDATVADAERLGGKVVKEPADIPNMGRFAVLTDPQGATFAVYTPPGPPPEGSEGAKPGPGEFTWHELATTDAAAALDFYGELFGWEKGAAHDMGGMGTYQLISIQGADSGGVYNLQGNATPPHWLSYVQVPDCTKATDVAKSEGARVLNGPMEVPGGSWITMMQDPQGGSFAVVEAPKAAAAKPAAKAKKPKADKVAAKADEPAVASAAEPVAKAGRKPAKKGAGRPAPKKAPAKKTAAKKKAAGKPAAKKKAAAGRPAPKKAAGRPAPKKGAARKAAGRASAKRGKSAMKKSGAAAGRPAPKKSGGAKKKGKRR